MKMTISCGCYSFSSLLSHGINSSYLRLELARSHVQHTTVIPSCTCLCFAFAKAEKKVFNRNDCLGSAV